ncbi:MAG: hypothetical protein WB565_06570 [Acidimicrobiales bacterium]
MTGAPSSFVPVYLGAGACPGTDPSNVACADPLYALAIGNSYSLSLPAGTWRIAGFYEVNPFGGVFLGTPIVVTIAGGPVTENLTVPYSAPSVLKGTVRVTGVPAGISFFDLTVLLCPSYAPFSGGIPSIACVNGATSFNPSSPDSAPFVLTGLPPGSWTAYPGYCTEFGCETNATTGKNVTLSPRAKSTVRLTTPFFVPGIGLLTGTITVPGAPPGFDDQVGVSVCQVGTDSCETAPISTGSTFTLMLGNGEWNVNGFYLVPPFYNAVLGPTQSVKIVGRSSALAVTVPYQILGTATGVIRVTGVPAHLPILDYTVLACPASSSPPGGFLSLQCVSESSGIGGATFGVAQPQRLSGVSHPAAAPLRQPRSSEDVYSLPTLTPGAWVLYPGYVTAFNFYADPIGTTVEVAAGQTTTKQLKLAYQGPQAGVVTGRVVATGAPTGSFQTGVRACDTPPTATSCSDEQETYTDSNGEYVLPLTPGTWWVSGFVDIFTFGPGVGESVSAPVKLLVASGSKDKRNFVVVVG